jgi:hypothetical protein
LRYVYRACEKGKELVRGKRDRGIPSSVFYSSFFRPKSTARENWISRNPINKRKPIMIAIIIIIIIIIVPCRAGSQSSPSSSRRRNSVGGGQKIKKKKHTAHKHSALTACAHRIWLFYDAPKWIYDHKLELIIKSYYYYKLLRTIRAFRTVFQTALQTFSVSDTTMWNHVIIPLQNYSASKVFHKRVFVALSRVHNILLAQTEVEQTTRRFPLLIRCVRVGKNKYTCTRRTIGGYQGRLGGHRPTPKYFSRPPKLKLY